MYSPEEFNDFSRRRSRLMGVGAAVGLLGIFAVLATLAIFRTPMDDFVRLRLGGTIVNVLPFFLIFLSCLFYVSILTFAERKSKRYALHCPNCEADLSRSTIRVLATRCCGECNAQIIHGNRTHTSEVFERYRRQQQRKFLNYWFWIWPLMGTFTIVWYAYDPASMTECMPVVFLPGLIGVVATGWTFARTIDKRYLPQLAASVLVFGVGAAVFWRSV